MQYDDFEKLKDQVGILVGLFNFNDDSIVKLAKIQLIQIGKNIVPILKTVLGDINRIQSEDQKKINTLSNNLREEDGNEIRINLRELFNIPNKFDGASPCMHPTADSLRDPAFVTPVVNGVLEVLSFFADNTLIETFSQWLPSDEAIEGLIKIGSKSAFHALTPTLDSIFSLKDSSPFGYSNQRSYTSMKDHIITDIANFVDKDVVSRFITSYPDLDQGLKDLVVGLIINQKNTSYHEQIMEWINEGSDEDVKRLSTVVISLQLSIDREMSKKLFSKFISNNNGLDSFLQYLLSNIEVDEMVEIELNLYLKAHQVQNEKRNENWIVFSNRYDYPDPESISKFIISKLQGRREDAITYISKVLTDHNKDKVKAASWLLQQITEAPD